MELSYGTNKVDKWGSILKCVAYTDVFYTININFRTESFVS